MMDFIDTLFDSLSKVNFVEINLNGEIPEEEERSLLPTIGAKKKLTLWDIERTFIEIENNPKLLGAIIKLSELRVGFARANLIRTRLLELRAKGKKIVVYLESGGNVEYLIASSADEIYLPPWSMLNLIGLKAEVTFYKDALDKIGVLAHMKGFGEYKSASETFTRGSMSKPHREMINSIIGDLQDQLEEFISQGRNIKPEEVKSLIDQGPYLADKACEESLVDGVLYESGLEDRVSDLVGRKLNLIKAGNLLRRLNIKDTIRSVLGKFTSSYPVIAVISDSGIITLGSSRKSGPMKSIGSDSQIRLLERVSKDRKVKAIVLRILSPGGSAVASDLISQKLEQISQKIPVVISMSDVAASGGYLISLGAHKVVADSMSITGSIGIVSGKFDLSGLYSKLGITKELVSKGKNALMFSSSKGFSKDEEEKLLEIMEFYYEQFVRKVSIARDMELSKTEQVSRGRVWTGKQAKERGLVDELGGINTAVNIAKRKAGIFEGHNTILRHYSEPSGFQLSSFFKSSVYVNTINGLMDSFSFLERENILTIMPFNINLK